MKKTILTCCILASAAVFSSSLYASLERCNDTYVRDLLVRSKWKGDKLVDIQKGYSYTVLNLATQQDIFSSPQERQDLALAKVQFTKFDPAAKACTVTLLRGDGGTLTVNLIYQKLKGTS